MDSTSKLKVIGRDYSPEAFYFKQHTDQHGDRLVAYTGNFEELKKAVYGLLSSYGLPIRVLLKITQSVEGNEQKWVRYSADFQRDNLMALMQTHEKFVFSHGFHVLCCKDIGTGDYFAIDEHDVLYCYGEMGRYMTFFAGRGFANRVEALVCQGMHWHLLPKNGEKLATEFIIALGLKKVNED